MTNPSSDWRENILAALPEERIRMRFDTFPSAMELIGTAAYNRRMKIADFVGRSALAVAVYDSDGELSWWDATDKEPPLADLRLAGVARRRLRGRNFGSWTIDGMSG